MNPADSGESAASAPLAYVDQAFRRYLECGILSCGGVNLPQLLADVMHAPWVGFAARGDPGWPKYELTRRTTMRFDSTAQVVFDPVAWKRALWEGVR